MAGLPKQIELGGVAWKCVAPSSALEVLEVEIFHAAHYADQLDGDKDGIVDLTDLCSWLAKYVVDADVSESWQHLDAAHRAAVIDRELGTAHIAKLRDFVISLASMPEDTLGQLEQFWTTAMHPKKCECAVCQGKVPFTDENQKHHQCRYYGVKPHTYSIASAYAGAIESDLLHGPYWLYQVKGAWQTAKSAVVREQQDERNKAQRAHEKSRAAGLPTQSQVYRRNR